MENREQDWGHPEWNPTCDLMLEHYREFLPKACQDLEAQGRGKLEDFIQKQVHQVLIREQLMREEGLDEDQIRELTRDDLYPPPERSDRA